MPIFGEPMSLRADVQELEALSGHADREEMLSWMKPIAPGLKKVFLVPISETVLRCCSY